jgi:hypothetical protein
MMNKRDPISTVFAVGSPIAVFPKDDLLKETEWATTQKFNP